MGAYYLSKSANFSTFRFLSRQATARAVKGLKIQFSDYNWQV